VEKLTKIHFCQFSARIGTVCPDEEKPWLWIRIDLIRNRIHHLSLIRIRLLHFSSIRIHKVIESYSNADREPQNHWFRVQCGSGSTTRGKTTLVLLVSLTCEAYLFPHWSFLSISPSVGCLHSQVPKNSHSRVSVQKKASPSEKSIWRTAIHIECGRGQCSNIIFETEKKKRTKKQEVYLIWVTTKKLLSR
jgi:hypothetical protein